MSNLIPDADVYAARRKCLMQQAEPDSVLLLAGAPEVDRNWDNTYRYRQDSYFYYLTGFSEPEAVLALVPGRENGEFILFNRPRDEVMEKWTGLRAGQVGACEKYGADEAHDIVDFEELLLELLKEKARIYYPIDDGPLAQSIVDASSALRKLWRRGVVVPMAYFEIREILSEMRLIKDASEIACMRKAAQISAAAHKRAMRACAPQKNECELEAELIYEIKRQGCFEPAYSSIVAAGENACTLHYVDNNSQINDGELVLIDAGGEYQYYASDVTRTFPANGHFSKDQQALYELVLKIQTSCIEQVRPGTNWDQLAQLVAQMMTEGLLALGILQGDMAKLLEQEAYRKVYPHGIGHWLGLDTHDVGASKVKGQWRSFEPGMVLTIEPGIYIPHNTSGIESRWWGIGIRIEDDVLVTADGCEVLSRDVPKTVVEIEALMQVDK